jgi:hypothetical protein
VRFSEERLAELISALPPAPPGWVRAAVELPAARAAIDGLVARALDDDEQRLALLRDLESALRAAGVNPSRPVLDSVRARLNAPERPEAS